MWDFSTIGRAGGIHKIVDVLMSKSTIPRLPAYHIRHLGATWVVERLFGDFWTRSAVDGSRGYAKNRPL